MDLNKTWHLNSAYSDIHPCIVSFSAICCMASELKPAKKSFFKIEYRYMGIWVVNCYIMISYFLCRSKIHSKYCKYFYPCTIISAMIQNVTYSLHISTGDVMITEFKCNRYQTEMITRSMCTRSTGSRNMTRGQHKGKEME